MAKEKPSIPKGTRDFGPQEVAKRKYILNTIEKVFIKYGFMPIETPTMENLSTLTGKYGDEGDKLLFNVLESGDFFKEIGNQLSKYQYYLIKSLSAVTNEIFASKEISKEEAKDSGLLSNFLVKNYEMICKVKLVENNLFKDPYEENEFFSKIARNYTKISILLSDFYYRARINDIENIDELNFQFEHFIVNNFENVLGILESLNDTNIIKANISKKGLRYDLTVPFARYVVMNRNEITFPFKRYQMQPVWRADKPQKGRYREFWQCDADVVGSDSLLNEIDLINIYHEVFKCLGIEVEIKINNRKILAGIAEGLGAEDKLIDFTVSLDKIDKIGIDGVENELKEKDFSQLQIQMVRDILFTESDSITYGENAIKSTLSLSHLSKLKNSSKFRDNENFKKGINEIETILECLNSTNKTVNIKLDISLARGLSYYTGCIFEVAAIDGSLRSSIGGGGRYDNLTGIFGLEGVSGVGISFGLDRMYDVMEELNLFDPALLEKSTTRVLICTNDSIENIDLKPVLELLKKLRDAGIASELYTEKINPKKPLEKPIKYASSKKIAYAIIYTENESLKLKNLETGHQEALTIEDIIDKLRS